MQKPSGRARRVRKIKNQNERIPIEIKNNLPDDLLCIVCDYVPDIIIDGVPKLDCQVSLDELSVAKNIHFYRSFKLRNGTTLKSCEKISGVPTIVATSLSRLFKASKIKESPDLSWWDVSNVRDMSFMFHDAKTFNADLSKWDVSNVQDMQHMFFGAYVFDSNISTWKVSNVKNMDYMFSFTHLFNSDLGDWDVSNVIYMAYMFYHANSFYCDLNNWDTSNVKYMTGMFDRTLMFKKCYIPEWYSS